MDIEGFIALIEERLGLPSGSIKSKRRPANLAVIRFCLYYILYHYDPITYTQQVVGDLFNHERSGVTYGLRYVERNLKFDIYLRGYYNRISTIFNVFFNNHKE